MDPFSFISIDDDPIDAEWALARARTAMQDAVSALTDVAGALHELELDLRRWDSAGVRAMRAALQVHQQDVESERAFVQHLEWGLPWQ